MSIGRNDPCPCGSGKKYKKCCLNRVVQGVPPAVERLSAFPPEVAEKIREAQE